LVKRKLLSFFVALVTWNVCVGIAVALADVSNRLNIEDPTALIPYIIFGAVLAAACVAIGGRFTSTRATLTGIVIGLLPSVIALIAGSVTMKGLEPLAAAWLAIPSGIGGGMGASLSSLIQRPQ
jgi:hypothetical protein